MSSPDFQILMLPLLEYIRQGEERSLHEIKEELIRFVELTDKEMRQFDPERDEPTFHQATALAGEHLIKAGLIEYSRSDYIKITSLGKMVLNKRLNSIDMEYLQRL